jgi:hypothetical protein
VRLVRLEKVATVENVPNVGDIGYWLANSPYTQTLISSGVNTVALWFGVYRGGQTVGMAADKTRVNLIGGGGIVERHEWGHNHHARHQPEDYQGVTISEYPTAFANSVDLQFATAVAQTTLCHSVCGTIPVYSTPSVSFNGVPTGTVERNNAGVLVQGAIDLGAIPKCGAGGIGSGGNSVVNNPKGH